MIENLKELQKLSGENANKHGWKVFWDKTQVKSKHDLSIGDALALCHSELSEALEDYRDNNKNHFGEELADEIIRVLHMAEDLEINLTEEVNKKMEKNAKREINHGRENL